MMVGEAAFFSKHGFKSAGHFSFQPSGTLGVCAVLLPHEGPEVRGRTWLYQQVIRGGRCYPLCHGWFSGCASFYLQQAQAVQFKRFTLLLRNSQAVNVVTQFVRAIRRPTRHFTGGGEASGTSAAVHRDRAGVWSPRPVSVRQGADGVVQYSWRRAYFPRGASCGSHCNLPSKVVTFSFDPPTIRHGVGPVVNPVRRSFSCPLRCSAAGASATTEPAYALDFEDLWIRAHAPCTCEPRVRS